MDNNIIVISTAHQFYYLIHVSNQKVTCIQQVPPKGLPDIATLSGYLTATGG